MTDETGFVIRLSLPFFVLFVSFVVQNVRRRSLFLIWHGLGPSQHGRGAPRLARWPWVARLQYSRATIGKLVDFVENMSKRVCICANKGPEQPKGNRLQSTVR
jgi:hypothetical protein